MSKRFFGRGFPSLLFFLLAAPGAFLLVQCSRDVPDSFSRSLDARISAAQIDATMEALATKPHRAGTPENRKVGEKIHQLLASYGLKTWTEESATTLEAPAEQHLFLDGRELDLREKVLPADSYTAAAATEIPFFAYSPDSDVQAEVVYGNFGTREDYALLKQMGISVRGKIVLLRAQGICRGMKGLIAEEEGAAGMLLYPERKDQGFRKPEYPAGPWLNPWTVMRGSMARYFLFPGNPVDPEGHPRPGILPAIPSIPISGANAQEIFRAMKGPAAPGDWQGIQTAYTVGPGPGAVRLVVRGDWQKQTLQNVFATIPGNHPEEGNIVVGSHYDAWVYGAADPISGVATILECARLLSKQAQGGWKPRRNIVFAFWDAEEYGMHGSSQWVRKNLATRAVPVAAYINIDAAVQAHDFVGDIMPGLRAPMEAVLSQVRDPASQILLSDIRPEYTLPGFSRDTTPFLGFSSVPVAEMGFGRWYSVYHSIYDDAAWYRRFNDPGYSYTSALVKILCLYLRDLSAADILPYRFSELEDYASDFLARNRKEPLSGIRLELRSFRNAARRFEEIDAGSLPDPLRVRINTTLLEAIQTFSTDPGPDSFGRTNVLIGPSATEGCSGDPFASLHAAVSGNDPQALTKEAARVQGAFYRCRLMLEKATRIAEGKE